MIHYHPEKILWPIIIHNYLVQTHKKLLAPIENPTTTQYWLNNTYNTRNNVTYLDETHSNPKDFIAPLPHITIHAY